LQLKYIVLESRVAYRYLNVQTHNKQLKQAHLKKKFMFLKLDASSDI